MKMKQVEYIGLNSLDCLWDLVDEMKVQRIFLVASKSAFKGSKFKEILNDLKKSKKIESVYIFSDFENNPKCEDVIEGVKLFKEGNWDAIISYGGGSTIDVAKLIKYFSCIKDDVHAELFPVQEVPHVAIPTTCGTGAEATHFAVMYCNGEKHSIESGDILPEYVVIDPMVLVTLPDRALASSIVDSLAQGIESYWSINSTDESKVYSMKCILLVMENYLKAFRERDIDSLSKLAKASNFSGKAINIAKTTAAHAMSYVLTSKYGIPHGQAVMILLPHVYEFNAQIKGEICDPRGKEYVEKVIRELNELLCVRSPEEAKAKLKDIMTSLNLETRLSEITSLKIDIQDLASSVNLERLKNNPIKIDKYSSELIYQYIV